MIKKEILIRVKFLSYFIFSTFMRNILFLSFTLLSFTIINVKAFAQPPDTLWTKTLGGSNIDVAHDIQLTRDGGYIIVGYTRSFGNSGRDIWLVKTDGNGNLQWHRSYGGSSDEEGYSIQQTTDGGYIVTGYTKSFGSGMTDVYIIKTDSLGIYQWDYIYGGSSDDEGYCVLQTSDGGYIIAGATSSYGAGSRDVWVIKTNSIGYDLWKKTYGGMSSDGAWSISKTNDGGYILTGWTLSYGPAPTYNGNVYLVKIDSVGNLQWQNWFGGSGVDRGMSVQQTSDGGYIIGGYTDSFGAGLYDAYLIKANSSGNQEWTKTFGGTGRDYCNSVQQTSDGGYILAGYTLSFGSGSEDFYIIKTDINGNEEWYKTYGGTYSDVANKVRLTEDGGLIIAGYTLSFGSGLHDVWLIKTAPLSNQIINTVTHTSGWNILSVPLQAQDMRKSVLFPNAVSPAYGFNNGYYVEDTLKMNKGYWLKFNESGVDTIRGIKAQNYSFNLPAGWNLIGPFEINVSTSSITTNPPNIFASEFFKYENGYQPTNLLEAGKGYWIKLSQSGTLIFPSTLSKTFNDELISSLHDEPYLKIQDADGNSTQLFLVKTLEKKLNPELPPSPPAGIYDVRFSGDKFIELFDEREKVIYLNSVNYPLTISSEGIEGKLSDAIDENKFSVILKSGESVTITNPETKILKFKPMSVVYNFEVYQNYPNPFNPVTNIKFSLPEKLDVKIHIYNLVGEVVETIEKQGLEAGVHSVVFDGSKLASGVYLYRIDAGKFKSVKKMLLIK